MKKPLSVLPVARSRRGASRRRPRLVCLGDLMLDIVVRADAPLESGTDVPGTIAFRVGGSAGNTARVFAGLGGTATLVCAVGSDGWGRRMSEALRGDGVVVRSVRQRGSTPRLIALIGGDGERSFVTDRGVADELSPDALAKAWFDRASALHVPAYSLLRAPMSAAAARAADLTREAGGLISIDLASRAPLLAAGADRGLRAVRACRPDVLFANMDEVTALVGARGAPRLLEVAPLVVVKQGSAGCTVLWRGTAAGRVVEIEVATKPLVAADTTGAGDAFDAGFLHALIVGGHGGRDGGDRRAAAAAVGGAATATVSGAAATTSLAARSATSPPLMRRAALAGHRAAARVLTSRRPELAL